MERKKIGFTIVMCLLLIAVTVGVTYAAFTFSKEGTIENSLETGTIVLTYTEGKTGITLNEAYPMSDEQGKLLTGENNVFDFTVQANLSRKVPIGYEVAAVKIPITDMTPLEDNEVKLYLERAIDPDTTYQEILAPTRFIPRDEQSEIGSPIGSMIIDSGTFINQGITLHHYRLRMWVDENADLASGVAKKYGIKINVYAKQDVAATTVDGRNPFIKKIYQYDQNLGSPTFCVTGEEATCLEIVKAPDIYEVGTIVKYKVDDTLEKYFHVVSDNDDTLTLQQRENTINGTPWNNDTNNSSKGPIILLPELEEATSSWSNVLDQIYTVETMPIPQRTAKARTITVEELIKLGCVTNQKSCPIWVYNYLAASTNYGGTVNNKESDTGYWTSEVRNQEYAYFIFHGGYITWGNPTATLGTRAVINVSK